MKSKDKTFWVQESYMIELVLHGFFIVYKTKKECFKELNIKPIKIKIEEVE